MTTLYRVCKRMIERGDLDGMSDKLDIFYASDRITSKEYAELTALLSAKKGGDAQ